MSIEIVESLPTYYQSEITKVSIQVGKPIITAESQNKGVYFIRSGRALVRKLLLNGETIFLKELDAGNCFGEMELFSDQSNTFEIVALTEMELYFLPREQVKEWMRTDFRVTQYLFEELNDKLQHSSNYIVQHNQGTTYEHLLHYLTQYPMNKPIKINKSEIAQALNTSLRNLNRAFLKGQTEGIFLWEQKELTLINKDHLLSVLEEI
ncbi:Crp/Fnr family transcriptional regulator [Vagococcus silagei]|uniref:Crp/Fnr family transcriptional regulator n=1 Tax=Vagococcus silagei TaxID=2508885 RepID=A0A4S3B3V1_9ENTE|nr:Crp/Fnr family transcriptional regulator [Vagococcus silagei]THB61128.1 Crp/Fnr family transcriptional regulator [Vagococcus silagei]